MKFLSRYTPTVILAAAFSIYYPSFINQKAAPAEPYQYSFRGGKRSRLIKCVGVLNLNAMINGIVAKFGTLMSDATVKLTAGSLMGSARQLFRCEIVPESC